MKLQISVVILIIASIGKPVSAQRWMRQQQQQRAQYCVTPENYYGSCVTLSYCPQITNVFQTGNQRLAQQYVILAQRACGTRSLNGDPVVCCTQPISVPQTTQRPIQPTTFNNPFLSTTERQRQPIPTSIPTRAPVTVTEPPATSANIIEDKGAYCRGPDIREGTCMPLQSCAILAEELKTKQDQIERFKNFIKASNLICGKVGTNVCCPNTNSQSRSMTTESPLPRNSNEIPIRLPTVAEGCGYSNNSFKRIVGGEASKKGAWPWIALLGYDDELSPSPFKCGATLITARHVLTAAHCVRNDLSFVRLGEHDLTTDSEARHVDIRISRSSVHPNYNRRNGHSDIAVLYLERNVEFTEFILPICLPVTEELQQKSYVKHAPFVAGWGKTMEGGTSANVLQELQIFIYENEDCREKYRLQNRLFTDNQFDKAVLCAGIISGGGDTCQGDSGGPLMMPEEHGVGFRFYLIGVVSYGIGCARPQIPGVYTSTQYFIDWIQEKVAESP